MPLMFQLSLISLTSLPAAGFQYGVPYTFRAQPVLAEPGRADTGWYFAAQKTGGAYPRTATAMREGGFSDLLFDASDPSGHTFWTIQDRGLAASYDGDGDANADNDTAYKVFAFPGHHQKLVHIRVTGDSVETLSRDSIAGRDTGFVTGLPSSRIATEEAAVRMRLDSAVVHLTPAHRIPPSPNGYDLEGLARTADGTFYLADEMGPRVLRLGAAPFRILREWTPGNGLPRVLAQRRDNRGLESLCATPSGKLAGLMQSGLANTVSGQRAHARDSTRVLRFFLFDPVTESVREHVYLADLKRGTRAPADVKAGAMACLGDSSFLVLEHGEDDAGYDWIDLYRIDITPHTSDVHEESDLTGRGRLFQGGLKTLEQVGYIPGDSAILVASGVTPLQKRLVFGDIIGRTAWRHDTPEGLAIVNDSTVAVLNDNDYGQKDEDGDGIPHLAGTTRRLTQLMYLPVAPGFATAVRQPAVGSMGGRGAGFHVRPVPGGWRVTGPRGHRVSVRMVDPRGRTVSAGHGDGAVFVPAPANRPGVYGLEVRAGSQHGWRRVFAP